MTSRAPRLSPEVQPPDESADRTAQAATGEQPMNRYVAPLSFTLAVVWVAVLFVLASTSQSVGH